MISVCLPVLNGGPLLDEVLSAVRRQRVPGEEVELVVADSGSTDGSLDLLRRHEARVIAVPRSEFSHGGTRDLLMRSSFGSHVAFLTQDATPASDGWLAALLRGFSRAPDVALAYGPYLPRPDAPHFIARELRDVFGPAPRVDRGEGANPFHSDANGCVSRVAYDSVPYRHVSYAEDQLLARDMLAAGYAKAYEPDAAVVHSHAYPPAELFGRLFDEFRALREVHGWVEPAHPLRMAERVQREVARDRAYLGATGARDLDRGTLESLRYHAIRAAAGALGSRADRLPPGARRALSRDRRDSFDPVA